MAPTSLIGQKTTTSPFGRDSHLHGSPIKVSEMLQHLDGVAYLERVSVHNPQNVRKAKKAIKKAFEYQIQKKGFTLIEILSTCPVNWGKTPVDAMKWVEEAMIPVFPLQVFKDTGEKHE
jgi:2-oxoglutarate ferredoxin oxidoreductase subunit beta